jgi:hypothetical protein
VAEMGVWLIPPPISSLPRASGAVTLVCLLQRSASTDAFSFECSVLIASFRSSIPSPPVPLFTLRRTPRGVQRKTRGRAVRYSFLVGLFHSRLHAGLSRRTALAISRQLICKPLERRDVPSEFYLCVRTFIEGGSPDQLRAGNSYMRECATPYWRPGGRRMRLHPAPFLWKDIQ